MHEQEGLGRAGPAPLAGVVIVPWEVPRVSEGTKDAIVGQARAEMARQFTRFELESAELVAVDNIRSLRITGTGRQDRVRRASAWSEHFRALTKADTVPGYSFKVIMILVPGRQRGYVLEAMAPAEGYAALKAPLEGFLTSFRVLERPRGLGARPFYLGP